MYALLASYCLTLVHKCQIVQQRYLQMTILFQVNVIEALTAAPRKVLEALELDDLPLVQHHELVRSATKVGAIFRELLLKFADVHHGINHSRPVTHEDLRKAGKYLAHSKINLSL